MSDVRPEDLERPELPAAWAWTELQHVVANVPNAMTDGPFGSNLKSDHYVPSGVRVIRLGNIGVAEFKDADQSYIPQDHYEALKKHEVFPGDLLIAALAEPVGRCCEVPQGLGTAIVKADCIRFVPNGALVKTLVMHWLNSPRGRKNAEKLSHGVGRLRMNLGNMRALPLPVAPANEQKRIVAKIEALQARSDAAKDALDAIPPLLEKFRQSVLAAAFRGDLTKTWRESHPDVEPASELLKRTPEPVGKSTGRAASDSLRVGRAGLSVGHPGTQPPPKWSWVPLGRIAKMESGHTPSREHASYWNGDIAWIGIADAREHHGREIDQTFQTVTDDGIANSAARLLPARTVCLSRTASVGYVTILGRSMATSQDFANWICTKALVPEFLMYALLAEGDGLRSFGEGSTHTTIYFPELKALHLCLAPLEEQREIVRILQERLASIDRLATVVQAARDQQSAINQSILAKAFRGELVPQDPNDEPASVLLDRIRREREGGGDQGTVRRGRGRPNRASQGAT